MLKAGIDHTALLLMSRTSDSMDPQAQAFLDANLDSVSPRWTARVTEVLQRPVAIPHLVFAIGVVFRVDLLFGVR